MRVFIVEDEPVASENLEYLLRKEMPDADIVGYAESVESAVKWLSVNAVDLIFLDIHLSDGSAFSIFERIDVSAPVVFTTAYDSYALDAFKFNSIDYLLKPVKAEDLRRAIQKYRHRTPPELVDYLSRLNLLSEPRSFCGRLLVQDRDRLIPLPADSICCIYSSNRHTEIILRNGESYPVGKPLEYYVGMLDPLDFIRANKQYIVARDAIRELVVWFDSRLKVRLSAPVPEPVFVSKNRVAEFKGWLMAR